MKFSTTQPHAPLARDEVLEIPIVFDKTIVSIAEKRCQRVPEDKEDLKVHRKSVCITSMSSTLIQQYIST